MTNNSHQLIVLASGIGSRLRPYTNDKPKCMVEFKGKAMIDYLTPSFRTFKNVVCVAGYESDTLKNHLKNEGNLTFTYNRYYETKNMVYSLFCASSLINSDIIVTYSDIIYNPKILSELTHCEETTIAVNKNWLKVWKNRMDESKIIDDAENIEIKNSKLLSLGGKIKSKMPDVQYMGIFKITNHDFIKLRELFLSLSEDTQSTIDMTKFINLAIQKQLIDFKILESSYDWIEIDSVEDLENLSKAS